MCVKCDYCYEEKEDVKENVKDPYLEAMIGEQQYEEKDFVNICDECYEIQNQRY